MFSFSFLTSWDTMYFNLLYSSSLFCKTLPTQASLYSQTPLYLGYENNLSLVHTGPLKPIVINLPSQPTPMYLFDSLSHSLVTSSLTRDENALLLQNIIHSSIPVISTVRDCSSTTPATENVQSCVYVLGVPLLFWHNHSVIK